MLAPSQTSLQSAIFLPLVKYIPIRSTLMSFSLPCQCAVDVYCICVCFLMYMCTCLRLGSRLASALSGGAVLKTSFELLAYLCSFDFLSRRPCHFPLVIVISLFQCNLLAFSSVFSFVLHPPRYTPATTFFVSLLISLPPIINGSSFHHTGLRDKKR